MAELVEELRPDRLGRRLVVRGGPSPSGWTSGVQPVADDLLFPHLETQFPSSSSRSIKLSQSGSKRYSLEPLGCADDDGGVDCPDFPLPHGESLKKRRSKVKRVLFPRGTTADLFYEVASDLWLK